MAPLPSQIRAGISIYRDLFRLHRQLDGKLRPLGNDFVRMEFRPNIQKSSEVQFDMFLDKWRDYQVVLKDQLAANVRIGLRMKKEDRKFLSDEQKERLDRLKNLAK